MHIESFALLNAPQRNSNKRKSTKTTFEYFPLLMSYNHEGKYLSVAVAW